MDLKLPVTLGKTYWMPRNGAERKKVTCQVCAGNLVVTVVDGFGKSWSVECDGCGLGFNGPRGYTEEYDWTPGVTPFTPTGLSSMHGEQWYLLDAPTGQTACADRLYETEAEALAVSTKEMAAHVEENMRRSVTSKAAMLKKKTWTLQYHGSAIKELERQLAWHNKKIALQKSQTKSST